MKILVLFDIAQRADPEEKFTPESLREQQQAHRSERAR